MVLISHLIFFLPNLLWHLGINWVSFVYTSSVGVTFYKISQLFIKLYDIVITFTECCQRWWCMLSFY